MLRRLCTLTKGAMAESPGREGIIDLELKRGALLDATHAPIKEGHDHHMALSANDRETADLSEISVEGGLEIDHDPGDGVHPHRGGGQVSEAGGRGVGAGGAQAFH